jgi:hypothetical protein
MGTYYKDNRLKWILWNYLNVGCQFKLHCYIYIYTMCYLKHVNIWVSCLQNHSTYDRKWVQYVFLVENAIVSFSLLNNIVYLLTDLCLWDLERSCFQNMSFRVGTYDKGNTRKWIPWNYQNVRCQIKLHCYIY